MSRQMVTDPNPRAIPHDPAAEAGALGAAITYRYALGVVVENLQPSDFFRPSNQVILEVLAAAHSDGWTPDAFLVHSEIVRRGHTTLTFEDVADLAVNAPPASTVMRYVEIVRRASVLRRMVSAATDIQDLALSAPADPFAALDAARLRLDDVADPEDLDSAVWVPDMGEILDSGLKVEEPRLLERVDGQRLLYSERMHTIQGLPSSGKSWIALHACREVLDMGGAAVYVDYEDHPNGITGRMMALGAEPESVKHRFQWVRPEAGFGIATQARIRMVIEDLNPDLVVIDGVAEAMAQDGLDENSNSDFLAWAERCPRWILRNFAPSVLMLDHVGKSKEAQQEGRHGRGAGAKLGFVDGATYTAKPIRPFSRERAGSTKLIIAKDRPGGVGAVGEIAGVFVIDPAGRGAQVTTRIDADLQTISAADTWKPTVLMEKASTELESAGPLTRKSLEAMIHSDKPKLVKEAIARLIAEGFVAEKRQGRTWILSSVKPFKMGESPPEETDVQETLDVEGGNVVPGPWGDKPDDPLLDF